jgi:hypothetical protein
MTFAIKAEVNEPVQRLSVFNRQKTMNARKRVAAG